jgi:DNA-binding response OmpR family regulator
MRVLLMDGYRPLMRALQRGLEEEGYTVDIAQHDPQQNGKPPATGYDVIILDLKRPGVADLALVRHWRQAGLHTPVLVLTAPGFGDMETRSAGIDAWVTKPFDLEDLLARLRNLLHDNSPS